VSSETGPAEDESIKAVAVLGDDLRRGMYRFVRTARRPVTRDETAAAVGVSRKLAAFHLDKLVDAGLLHDGFAGADGGRKVGRRPKVYQPADVDIRVAIPARNPDLLAGILVDAVVTAGENEPARAAALRVATRRGTELGVAERERIRPGRLGPERALTVTERLLAGYGFEPRRAGPTRLRLRSCPFHPIAERAPDLVCGLNRAFLQGILDGLRAPAAHAAFAPAAGECCVELRQAPPPDRGNG
jgi:predicted ArsR family transcriptional regulator